ncbi:MAG: 4-hydroxyphenylpyruvate dioxygenase, partial [Inhella sp.]
FAQRFVRLHGPSICAIAFRVKDAAYAYQRALELGAWGFDNKTGPMELNIPAIKGIGDSLIYFVDRWHGKDGGQPGQIGNISIYDVDFVPLTDADGKPVSSEVPGYGLGLIDHLTHNVYRGRMKEWADFYERLFNFREVRYFDIEGKLTGLKSKAMTSPCGKIRIPINESSDDKSQIAEYLHTYNGEGIQHVALSASDIYGSVDGMKQGGVEFQDTIETYFDLIDKRLPGHGENLAELRRLRILIDGAAHLGADKELLLQIFTKEVIGPIFFEIIQRKGNEGFGEGNFQALFESIELDQIRRGVLKDEATPA